MFMGPSAKDYKSMTHDMLLVRMVGNACDTIRFFVVFAGDEHFRWGLILVVPHIEHIDNADPIARQYLSANGMPTITKLTKN